MASPRLTRRDFIAGSAAVAASAALPLSACGASRGRVVVVGAGLAGLTAAYELRRAGWNVTVIEARGRVGGRVRTVRFADGQHAEAGGEFVDTGHRQLLAYVRRFGLGLEDLRQQPGDGDGDAIAYLRGRRRTLDSLYTDDVERQLARWERVVESYDDRADDRSVADLMDEAKLAGVARTLVSHGEIRDDYTVEPGQLSALFHVRYQRLLEGQPEQGEEVFRIRAGNDRLPRELARRLGGAVQLNAPVSAIRQSADGIKVVAAGRELSADYCVVATPLPPLRRVAFDPAPPARLAEAIEQLQYGRAVKTLLQYRRRFWSRRELSGDTFTDLTLGTTWDGTNGQRGAAGVLVGYTTGAAGARFGRLSDSRRIATAAAQLERIYPGSRRLLGRAVTLDWRAERYSGGSYSAFAPGQFARYRDAVSAPHGRIHFAGEHTDAYSGYMEGAIRSGRRAAAELEQRG